MLLQLLLLLLLLLLQSSFSDLTQLMDTGSALMSSLFPNALQ